MMNKDALVCREHRQSRHSDKGRDVRGTSAQGWERAVLALCGPQAKGLVFDGR